jgi:LmbE family N-acetylglucosaminyl deacetylase
MEGPYRLMVVVPHPDDESLGMGGTLAKYAAEGVEIELVMATRGERGWGGPEDENPGLDALGRLREKELLAAAQVLGVRQVSFLDYIDGEVDQVDPAEAVMKIAAHIRRARPHVIITFDPFGAYGHPDHIAIAQFTLGAVVAAADAGFLNATFPVPHRVSKVYFMADTVNLVDDTSKIFGSPITHEVDGVLRQHTGWPAWAVSARIDTRAYWPVMLKAILCHESQVSEMADNLRQTPQLFSHPDWWAEQTYYRALSFVNGGRQVEDDLFVGVR